MVLIIELSEDTWNNVLNYSPEWDNLTLGGSPDKKIPKKKILLKELRKKSVR